MDSKDNKNKSSLEDTKVIQMIKASPLKKLSKFKNIFSRKKKNLNIFLALTPIFVLGIMVVLDFTILKLEDVRVSLILAIIATIIVGLFIGKKWDDFEKGIAEGIKSMSFGFMFIMVIGMLISSWIMGGIIPSLVYFGMELINPAALLLTSFVVCAILGTALGSSWTTIGTVGAALIGIGSAQGFEGIHLSMLAGAIVSGSYFGDKISPISDTTALAASSAEVDMWRHFKYNLRYSIIGFGITLILYLALTFTLPVTSGADQISNIQSVMDDTFNISIWNTLPLLLIIPVVIYKLPAIPSLMGLIGVSAIMAVLFHGFSINEVIQGLVWELHIIDVIESPVTDLDGASNIVSKIVNKGGLSSTYWTISLVLCSAIMVGCLETIGAIDTIGKTIKDIVRNDRELVASATVVSASFSIISGDHYVGITVPSKLLRHDFEEAKLDLANLSRASEDGGTTASPLVPWTSCGANASAILGVSTFSYAAFAFFPIISIALGIIFPLVGYNIIGKKNFSKPRKY